MAIPYFIVLAVIVFIGNLIIDVFDLSEPTRKFDPIEKPMIYLECASNYSNSVYKISKLDDKKLPHKLYFLLEKENDLIEIGTFQSQMDYSDSYYFLSNYKKRQITQYNDAVYEINRVSLGINIYPKLFLTQQGILPRNKEECKKIENKEFKKIRDDLIKKNSKKF